MFYELRSFPGFIVTFLLALVIAIAMHIAVFFTLDWVTNPGYYTEGLSSDVIQDKSVMPWVGYYDPG